jgi:hypothetical protein
MLGLPFYREKTGGKGPCGHGHGTRCRLAVSATLPQLATGTRPGGVGPGEALPASVPELPEERLGHSTTLRVGQGCGLTRICLPLRTSF